MSQFCSSSTDIRVIYQSFSVRVSLSWQYFCVLWGVQMDGNSHILFGLEIAQTQPQYGNKPLGEGICI